MDPFAHFSTGAVIGKLFLYDIISKELGDKNALIISLLLGGILGILPDIDILYKKFISNIKYLEIHRTWTHSIFSHIVIAFFFCYLFCQITQTTFEISYQNIKLFFAAFIILFSHIFLDALTSWGVFYFYPFKVQWSLKSMSVVDLVFDFFLLVQLILLTLNLQSYIPFFIAICYLIFSLINRETYIKPLFKRELKKQEIIYSDLFIKPVFSNAFIWTCIVKQGDKYYTGYYSLFQNKKSIEFSTHSRNEILANNSGYLESQELIHRIKKVTSDWVSFTVLNKRLFINDVRYGFKTFSPDETRYAVSYEIIDEKADVISHINPLPNWYKIIWNRLFAK